MLYNFIQGFREKIKGYKTLILNSLVAIPSALAYLFMEFQSSGVDITPLIPAKYAAAAMAVLGVMGIVLRIYTTGSLGSKDGLPSPNGPTDDVKEPI